ncbi:phenylacetate--CoA ligase [Candidatus Sumerlaeota bacterium]|nr:phenylacetate--CoA ligase [Candidatus Sumerlaeota bacterium]
MSDKKESCNCLEFNPVSAPDYLPKEQLRGLQSQRLRKIVSLAYNNVQLYKERMDAIGVKPEDIKTIDDLRRMPFTQKTDLRDYYPFGLFAVPMSDVVRVHASSGTTGKPIVVSYTKEDLNVWSSAMMRCMAAAGLGKGDIVQVAYGYGLFTGGLGAHYGAETLGATVIPVSGGHTDRQLMLMRDFGTTAICCTPSYFVHMIEKAEELGISFEELPLRVGIFGAEPWTEGMRQYIKRNAGIQAFDIYGLSEIVGPGCGIECVNHDGLHILEDLFYVEIVNPETGEPLPDGEEGELVLTTLSKYAMPMIRYRTHDITSIIPEPCSCGRTLRRIRRIGRRSDDMFIIRGVNVFPSQIETALLSVEGTLPHYQIVLSRHQGLDEMEVQVEITGEMFADTISGMEELRRKISYSIERIVNIRAKIMLVEPNTIVRSEGKAKRVVDNRQDDVK